MQVREELWPGLTRHHLFYWRRFYPTNVSISMLEEFFVMVYIFKTISPLRIFRTVLHNFFMCHVFRTSSLREVLTHWALLESCHHHDGSSVNLSLIVRMQILNQLICRPCNPSSLLRINDGRVLLNFRRTSLSYFVAREVCNCRTSTKFIDFKTRLNSKVIMTDNRGYRNCVTRRFNSMEMYIRCLSTSSDSNRTFLLVALDIPT